MITFACFVPHAPLLIPEIGKENLEKLSNTVNAYQNLEYELYASKPDVIIVISPHVDFSEDSFAINQNPKLKINFKKFGDLITSLEFSNELGLGYQIRESVETSLPVVLYASEELDYGSGVPLYHLAKRLKDVKIVTLGYANQSNKKHIEFGEAIKEQLSKSGKRIALIASGDLAHRLHKDSPSGYSPLAQDFDQKIMKLLDAKKIDEIVNMDDKLLVESGQCGFRSLLILLGIIKNLNYEPERLSYESPFGIGYLVENFKIK